MLGITIEKLMDKVDSKYRLVLIAAQRAVQLAKGAPPLVDAARSRKPTYLALEELAQGKLTYRIQKNKGRMVDEL